jgi:hypothetical protein
VNLETSILYERVWSVMQAALAYRNAHRGMLDNSCEMNDTTQGATH